MIAPISNNHKIFIIAGEPSGDLHGANLIKSLKKQYFNIDFSGIGGVLMESQGFKSMVPMDKMAIMGFIEVVKHLPFFLKLKKKILLNIKSIKYDHIILIDYPGFNLNLLPSIRKITKSTITYYICPQLWAWKEKRIKILKKYVDNRIVIFPFEEDWYNQRGVKVFFPGHPIFDQWHPTKKTELVKKLAINPNKPILTLYPGSRLQEFNKHFPILLESAKIIKSKIPDLQVLVGYAKSLNINSLFKNIPKWVKIEKRNPNLALEIADAAIITSGTATLEAAVFSTPGIIVYKMSAISWWLTKRFVKVRYSGMVNLIANKEVMPELLQNKANSKNISKYIYKLLMNKNLIKEKQLQLEKVRQLLGKPGASDRIAKYILNRDDSSN